MAMRRCGSTLYGPLCSDLQWRASSSCRPSGRVGSGRLTAATRRVVGRPAQDEGRHKGQGGEVGKEEAQQTGRLL